jgi:hypothetical protein
MTNEQQDRELESIREELKVVRGFPGTGTFTLPSGMEVTVRHEVDGFSDVFRDTDCYGKVQWHPWRAGRPQGFDGAARTIDTNRSASFWWQPPEDLKSSPEQLRAMESRVRDYVRGGWWMETREITVSRPCPCCEAMRVAYSAVLGGIESDTPFEEMFDELWNMLEPVK